MDRVGAHAELISQLDLLIDQKTSCTKYKALNIQCGITPYGQHAGGPMLTSVPGHCLVGYPRRSTTWAVAIGLVECSFTARRRFPGLGHTIILSFSLQENVRSPLSAAENANS